MVLSIVFHKLVSDKWSSAPVPRPRSGYAPLDSRRAYTDGVVKAGRKTVYLDPWQEHRDMLPHAVSVSMALSVRYFMQRYRFGPHSFPETYRSLAQTSIKADCPSGRHSFWSGPRRFQRSLGLKRRRHRQGSGRRPAFRWAFPPRRRYSCSSAPSKRCSAPYTPWPTPFCPLRR